MRMPQSLRSFCTGTGSWSWTSVWRILSRGGGWWRQAGPGVAHHDNSWEYWEISSCESRYVFQDFVRRKRRIILGDYG
jgi:hypothetical protein